MNAQIGIFQTKYILVFVILNISISSVQKYISAIISFSTKVGIGEQTFKNRYDNTPNIMSLGKILHGKEMVHL